MPSRSHRFVGFGFASNGPALAGRNDVPAANDAAVWLYGEVLPKAKLTEEQALTEHRISALSLSNSVDEVLIRQAVKDCETWFAETSQ